MTGSRSFSGALDLLLGLPQAAVWPAITVKRGMRLQEGSAATTVEAGNDLVTATIPVGELEAALVARRLPGGAIEIDGTLTNLGSDPVMNVEAIMVGAARLPVGSRRQGTVVRTWHGNENPSAHFPPDEFEPRTRRLIDVAHQTAPVTIHSGAGGRSSSVDMPFFAIEGNGAAVVVAIDWSGTWQMTAGQTPGDLPRSTVDVQAGIWGLDLTFAPGQQLNLPRVTVIPFDADHDTATNALRRHVRAVVPRLGGDETLPFTSFNHWFAFQNDYTDEMLKPAVDACAAAGLEYFVVDAGWFEGGFRRGIGNWDRVDPVKFPKGIRTFSRYVEKQGMKFGLWFEPEFAHIASSTVTAHPDWFLRGPRRSPYTDPTHMDAATRATGYGERDPEFLLMDFGLPAVQDYWVETLTRAYREWGVRWIRWDANQDPRSFWDGTPEPGWSQVRHIQGLYAVHDRLLRELPDLAIEQCASGGHRIDLGLVRRSHTIWMSDQTTQTDIVRRLQTGLNRMLTAGYANTNLCQFRHDFSARDYLSHLAGSFGYSGRIWEAPPEQAERLRTAVAEFRRFRHLLLGDFDAELSSPGDPDGHEVYRWSDGDEWVAFEFGGELGIGGARLSTSDDSESSFLREGGSS